MTPPNREKRPRLVLVPAARLDCGATWSEDDRPMPPDDRRRFFFSTCLHPSPRSLDRGTDCFVQSSPAPRAHLYFAPSTATGISVEYGYAGMPCWNRCSAASSTCTSPASDATIGLWMPCAFISSTTSTTRF